MANDDIRRIARALDARGRRAKKDDELEAYLGKPDGSGNHTVPVAHHPGYSYIRGTDGIEGWIGEAINVGAMQNPAIKLEVSKKNGVLVVRSPDATSAAGVLGANAPAAGSTPVIESVNTGTGAPIASERVERGRLSLYGANNAALGGLRVRITAYTHRGGAWDGAHVETLTPTATSGMHSWVLCGVNTKTNAFTQALSENRSLAQPLLANDYFKIMRQYLDVDWRAAIDVANGATSLDEGKITDLRTFGATGPKTNYTATAAPTTGDDADDGYGVGSIWIDVTGDAVYVCVDATAGAAVWKVAGDFLASGTVAMTGDLNLNGNDLTNTATALFNEGAAPATPSANKVIIYAKSDGLMYAKDDAGTETPLGGSGTGIVESVVAGTNISVDNTDPANPVVAATSTPGGGAAPSICEGRLTLTSGTPVTTSDVTAAGTVYFTPYNGNYIGLYDGSSAWELKTFSELSISLAGLLPHSYHDVFIYNNAGTPTLELTAWTAGATGAITGATNATPIVITSVGHGLSTGDIVTITGVGGNTAANGTFRITSTGADTFSLQTLAAGGANVAGSGAYTSGGNWYKANYAGTRATAITTQDGISVKTGATTRRLLGTIRITNTAAQTEDSVAKALVSNLYNAVPRVLKVNETTNSWSYGTSAFRAINNNWNNRLEVVFCENRHIALTAQHSAARVTGNGAGTGVGIDSVTTDSALTSTLLATGVAGMQATYNGYQTGGHFIFPLENTNGVSNTFYGDLGVTYCKTGLTGMVWN